MRYSSRKLINEKVITRACNFCRHIAGIFQVMSGNILKSRYFLEPCQGILAKKVTLAHYVFRQ